MSFHLSLSELRPPRPLAGSSKNTAAPLSVLVVNNMPDAALRATERQYCSLLAAASEGLLVDLRFTTLPGISRQGSALDHVRRYYEDHDAMIANPPDGLIVTGAEPRASDMTSESSWPALSRLIDWVERVSVPAVWSCLAAHAAVLRLDGIERVPLKRKLSGVFACEVQLPKHRLVQGCKGVWRIPHSRMNGLSRRALEANGYSIISSSHRAGVDAFAKQDGVLHLYFQGHPEYGEDTLLAEHRRDMARAVEAHQTKHPSFRSGLAQDAQWRGWTKSTYEKGAAGIERRLHESADLAGRRSGATEWSGTARMLYANWLAYLEERRSIKQRQLCETGPTAAHGSADIAAQGA